MFLIMSGSYVDQELNAEFGRIPPSFLPLGNRRLFQHQFEHVPQGCQAYLSIPENYNILDTDLDWLQKSNVILLKTTCDLTLGEALVTCLNLIDRPLLTSLHVLFGDTLFRNLPLGDDILAVSNVESSYQRSAVSKNGINWLAESAAATSIVCGYFKFSDPVKLVRNITLERWDFIRGIDRYKKEVGLYQVQATDWYDFGHVNTYYHSKAAFTTQRSFNELTINPRFIEKSSIKNEKIKAEANWFNSLPCMLKVYTPQYLGHTADAKGRFSYRLEYLHNTALNELFVFSEMSNSVWDRILTHCLDFIDECRAELAPDNSIVQNIEDLFSTKTKYRLKKFLTEKRIKIDDVWNFNADMNVTVSQMLAESEKHLPSSENLPTVMHGDFCFSNILYDFRSNRIKTIDPRGLTTSGDISIYGDTHYDVAKLSHSILGMYDWIVAGYHQTNVNWDKREIQFSISGGIKHKGIQASFVEMVRKRYELSALNLYAMQLQLFLSMLPLHADDAYRQDGIFANAFRVYKIMKRYEE